MPVFTLQNSATPKQFCNFSFWSSFQSPAQKTGLSSKAGNFNSTQRSQLCQSGNYTSLKQGISRNVQTEKTQWLSKNLLYTSNLKKPLFCHTGQNQMNIFISIPLVIIFLHYDSMSAYDWHILDSQDNAELSYKYLLQVENRHDETSAHISCVTYD